MKHTPGPWHVDEGYIKNKEGDVLASLPYTLGDQTDWNNTALIAAAPDLLAACIFALNSFENMTTEAFSQGADKPARDALRAAVNLISDTEGDNMSKKTVRDNISKTEEQARDRINEMGFTAKELDFIFADWSEGEEHFAWLLTASKNEISDWIKAGQDE
jgi:hypothetical protein